MKRYFIQILGLLLLICSCTSRENFVLIRGYAQGGTYSVKCSDADIRPEELKNGIDSILGVIDRSVSGYNPESLVSRWNKAEALSPDSSAEWEVFNKLVGFGDMIYSHTGGAVDTRAAALFDIWGFGFKEGNLPSAEQIKDALADRSKLNFNAIAQGFSSDEVAAYLHRHAVKNMLVDIGGEIYCCGHNPSGKGWTIAIDAPFDGNMNPGEHISGSFTIKPGRECGVVTSGNYRKYYVVDSVKYSHTIDPRCGSPVRHSLLSATIIAPNSTLADALATFCMVIGPDQARDFILSRPDLEACLICADSLWTSPGFPLNK